ncbi:MAG: phosphate signaling complex protein PhoU [Methanoregulaceae archaeon]|jgi:phosphate transport system protein|nr:phosphate signaling complex protein PhoU [Methanoregulaceae archaeon]
MDPNVHRNVLSQQISELEHALLDMGSRAEAMVGRAVDSLVRGDADAAMQVVRIDDEVDLLDLEIEERCVSLLALQNPIASDLRLVGTALKMITDIERVGDLAVDIAKAGMKVEKELGDSSYIDFPKIAGVARTMLRDALQAFVKRDLDLVASVIARDDEVDELYRVLRGQIHDRMRRSPEDVVAASWLLLALHHIERIADHAVNIAERVSFMVTGKFQQLAPSHGPESTA